MASALTEFAKPEIDKFMKSVQAESASKRIGIAEGKFVVQDDFDDCNDEIAEMFRQDKEWIM